VVVVSLLANLVLLVGRLAADKQLEEAIFLGNLLNFFW